MTSGIACQVVQFIPLGSLRLLSNSDRECVSHWLILVSELKAVDSDNRYTQPAIFLAHLIVDRMDRCSALFVNSSPFPRCISLAKCIDGFLLVISRKRHPSLTAPRLVASIDSANSATADKVNPTWAEDLTAECGRVGASHDYHLIAFNHSFASAKDLASFTSFSAVCAAAQI